MFPAQCEELRINHLTILPVVTNALYMLVHVAGRIILRTSSDIFIFNLRLRVKGCFERGIFWKGPNHVWMASKTSITPSTLSSPVESSWRMMWHVLEVEVLSLKHRPSLPSVPKHEARMWDFQDCRLQSLRLVAFSLSYEGTRSFINQQKPMVR